MLHRVMTFQAVRYMPSWLPSLVLCGILASCQAARATTYYCDPVGGNLQNDGSTNSPWPKLEDAASSGKLSLLRGGDTLLLRSGNHGNVRISGANTTPITIAAAFGQQPQLGRLEVDSGSNWLLKGLTISPTFSSAPYKTNIVTLDDRGSGHDVVLQDCFVCTATDSTKWTKDDWMNAYDGIFVGRGGTHITLRNDYVLNTRFGVSLCAPDSLAEGNVIANFSGDGLRITRDGITAQYNVVRNSYLGSDDGDTNHDDLIQCFLFNKGFGTVKDVTIANNILIGNENPNQPFLSNPQGIGCFDGPLINFDIEHNVIGSNIYHGITLYDATNCKIRDNVVKARSTQKAMPWIALGTKNRGGCSGNVVQNNWAHSFILKADPSVVTENNAPVTDTIFNQRFQDEAQLINGKFGKIHPVANLPRLTAAPNQP